MNGELLNFVDYKGTKIEVIKGDLTEEGTEAIVNAANSYLRHGGGVAGAIVRKGGCIIQEESDRIGYVPVGKAAITGAGNLKAKYVIHAVGPKWGEGEEDKKLESAVFNVLSLAAGKGIKSLSLPAISTGIFGFPKDRGVEIILNTIKKFIEDNPNKIELIRCVSIDKTTADIFNEKLIKLFKKEEV